MYLNRDLRQQRQYLVRAVMVAIHGGTPPDSTKARARLHARATAAVGAALDHLTPDLAVALAPTLVAGLQARALQYAADLLEAGVDAEETAEHLRTRAAALGVWGPTCTPRITRGKIEA